VVDRGFIGGVIVSVLVPSVVDRGFVGDVIVSVLVPSVVDRGFVGDVMVSVLVPSVVDRGFVGDVMVSVLVPSVVDCGFVPRSGQTKDYEIGICRFSFKHVELRRKKKDWLARNQNNVSEWSNMSICALLFRGTSTIKIQLSGPHHHFFEN
jgi:hypothetical protein